MYFLYFLKWRISPKVTINDPLKKIKNAILSPVIKIVEAPIIRTKKMKIILLSGWLKYFKKKAKYKIKNKYLAKKIPGIGLSLNGPVNRSGLKEYFGLPKKS